MHILIVYQKSDRKMLASFNINTIVTEMDVLVVPGVAYLMTFDKSLLYMKDGEAYVRETEKERAAWEKTSSNPTLPEPLPLAKMTLKQKLKTYLQIQK